jgi:hypothetical protein
MSGAHSSIPVLICANADRSAALRIADAGSPDYPIRIQSAQADFVMVAVTSVARYS